MSLSCRTGSLRVGQAFACLFSRPCKFDRFSPPVGRDYFLLIAEYSSVVAAEAVDEATVAFGWAFGGCGCIPGHGAEEFSFFGGFVAEFFALFGLAVERLCDGGRAALLAEGEHFDLEFAAFVFNVKYVADAHLAGRLGRLIVRSDAV
jgi:hypothetical protein